MSEQPVNPYQPQPGAYDPYAMSPSGVPMGPPPEHPQATTVLILGIVGLAVCQLTAPFAWVIGGRARREIDASGGRLGGRQQVTIGWVCGIIGTAVLVLSILAFVAYIIFVVVLVSNSPS